MNKKLYLKKITKATDQQILDVYKKTNNIWETGKELGMCGQSIWERLKKLNVDLNNKQFTDLEFKRVKEVYESGIVRGDNKLKQLSIELNRTIPFISRKAKELGLTSYNRLCNDEIKKTISIRTTNMIKTNGHPKGFLNHHFSEISLNLISTASKKSWSQVTEKDLLNRQRKSFDTRVENGTIITNRQKTTWKQQWATIGGKKYYFRSQWEVNYAIYLEFLKTNNDIIEWVYEVDTFWFESIKRGVRSFRPDFKVTENDGSIIYHEVKGWMDSRSKTTLSRFKKYYPKLKLVLIQKQQYNEILKKFSFLYK
jgi:hypothetical protein